jgi:hypothetical protein
MSFLVLFGLVILCVGFAYVRTYLKRVRLSRLSWDDLIGRLEPVSGSGISTIALDYLQPSKGQARIETSELWTMIGGADGLRRLDANAEILIALAGYAQRWNLDESVIVAERMRRDGVALRRATFRLSLGLTLNLGKASGPFYLQEAAGAYYLMRQRLLALYETSHVGRYPRLAEVLAAPSY